jgi:hypothetical protein
MDTYESFKYLVAAVEENNRLNDAKWSNWEDRQAIEDLYGVMRGENREVGRAFLTALIRDNGEHLDTYLDAMCAIERGLVFSKHI